MWICWGNAFSLKLDNCNRKERRKQAIQPVRVDGVTVHSLCGWRNVVHSLYDEEYSTQPVWMEKHSIQPVWMKKHSTQPV